MHEIRLVVPAGHALPDDVHERVFLADFFGAILPCHAIWDGAELCVQTSEASGYLQLPCILPDGGERMMRSATLIARKEPYVLPLELARGILHRMSNRFWEWKLAGMDMTARFGDSLTATRTAFSHAVVRQHDPSCRGESAQQAFQLARALMANMSTWMSEVLIERASKLNHRPTTMMIGRLPSESITRAGAVAFARSFDMAAVPADWKTIQPNAEECHFDSLDERLKWCQQRDLKSIVGPLVDLCPQQVPPWLSELHEKSGKTEDVVNAMLAWITAVVNHCRGNVSMWHATTELAGAQSLPLNITQRFSLAAESISLIRKLDPDAPILISFDQPFGEFFTEEEKVDPASFVASLLDNRIVPDAVGLDLRFDVWPRGSVRRDPIDLFRRLDRWADLEVPLFVFLSAPSARHAGEPSGDREVRITHRQPSRDSQSRVISDLAGLLITHPAVQAICWNEWSDSHPYRLANSGLLTANDEPKQALEVWRSLLPYAAGR